MSAAIDLGDGWKAKPKFLRLVLDRSKRASEVSDHMRESADAFAKCGGEDLAGYALVAWTRTSAFDCSWKILSGASPFGAALMPHFVAEHLTHSLHEANYGD